MSDTELIEGVKWWKHHYRKTEVTKSCFETFVCGHFHTYPKRARYIAEEMQQLGLISIHKGIVKVN